VLLVADTHLRRGDASRLIDRIRPELDHADVIVHAGDITDASVLDELARFAPVHAVRGNNDVAVDLVRLLPERACIDVDGCCLAIVHDSGPAVGRTARLRRWFPDADVVVFGHSHIPWHERHTRDDGHVQHHVNPGSAMQRRRQPECSAAEITIAGGEIVDVHRVLLPHPSTS
jgi:putative phosphoesterase